MMKNVMIVCMLLACAQFRSAGQALVPQVINSSGYSFSNNDVAMEWSVGELAVVVPMQASIINGGYQFSNGFLQPFALNPHPVEKSFGNNEIRIFPNPTHGRLQVDFRVQEQGRMKLFVFDVMGQAIYAAEFMNNGAMHSEYIDLSAFAGGTYMLQATLTSSNDPMMLTRGSYKIIKIH